MTKNLYCIPKRSKIETEQIPIEWLHHMALCEGNSKKPIYRIHKWWARRLGSVFRTLLLLAVTPSNQRLDRITEDFYSKHDFRNLVVLDPFMGGGTSIIEASKCGARTIGTDIDPVAWFVTKKEIEPCPVDKIHKVLKRSTESIGNEIRSYYLTRTPDGREAPVIYFFWVDLITCPNCQTEFEAHLHYQLSLDKRKLQQNVFCSKCHAIATIPLFQTLLTCSRCKNITKVKSGTVRRGKFSCPQCGHSGSVISVIQRGKPLPKRLFAVEYEAKNADGKLDRFYKAADANDIGIFKGAECRFNELQGELPFPRVEIPREDRSDPRPISHGYRYYYQLFNPRQLLCLSLLWREITRINDDQIREYLMIAFSDSLASNNMLCSYAFAYRKLTPLFGLHAFNVVNRPVENNVWGTYYGRGSFLKCVNKMLKGKLYAYRPYEITYQDGKPKRVFTGERIIAKVATTLEEWHHGNFQSLLLNRSSTELGCLEPGSVDLILTDPPYYNNLSYSELSDFYYVWIRESLPKVGHNENNVSTPYQRALYVNKDGDPSHYRFVQQLTHIFAQCRRVLRPGGLMVFTFHHRDSDAWEALAKALWEAGFKVVNIFPVRSEGKSGFHSTSGTIKWDCVLVCRIGENQTKGLCDSRGFLGSVQASQKRWIRRLQKASLVFAWTDALSLGYALAVQQAVARAGSPDDITTLLNKAKKFLVIPSSPKQFNLSSQSNSKNAATIDAWLKGY